MTRIIKLSAGIASMYLGPESETDSPVVMDVSAVTTPPAMVIE
jgi:hypothetical protein